MKRLILLALGLATSIGLAAKIDSAPRPNIIFILCDDLGYGDVGVFHQNQRSARHDRSVPFFTTPHIDTLARDGVRMNQHYSAAPVCAPSRASLLTGLTQGHANVRDAQFDKALPDSPTVGTVLKQAGYATAAFGKWGLQGGDWQSKETKNPAVDLSPAAKAAEFATWNSFPTRRGFDYFYGYVRHVDGHFHYPKEDERQVWQNDREVSGDLDKCYTADLWTARAKNWIVEQSATHPAQPFFVFLAYDTPHAKLQNPSSPYPAGGGLKGGVQWTGRPHAMLNTATGIVDGYMHPDYAEATWDDDHDPATPEVPWPDVQKRYANDVRRIDDGVGDLLQLLQDLRIADNTLVVFTSDNGPSIESYLPEEYTPTFFQGYGPFDGIKRDTLEGGVREPTLARWPALIPAGRQDNEPSGQWNWLDTFAAVAGVPAPAASDGVSLLPSLTGRGEQSPGTVYMEYFHNGSTPEFADFVTAHRGRKRGQMQNIYLNGYMGVRYNVKSSGDDFEIYDVNKDPHEAHDLGSRPEMAGLQTAMKARVLQVRMPNASAPRPYDDALVPSLKNMPDGSPGLKWSLFKGEWPWLPEYRTLKPFSQGNTKSINLAMAPTAAAFGVAFEALFHATQDGEYSFFIESDSDAMLFLHDIRVIDGTLGASTGSRHGAVKLRAGWHPLRLYYRHASGTPPRLDLTCQLRGAGEYKLSPPVFQSLASHD